MYHNRCIPTRQRRGRDRGIRSSLLQNRCAIFSVVSAAILLMMGAEALSPPFTSPFEFGRISSSGTRRTNIATRPRSLLLAANDAEIIPPQETKTPAPGPLLRQVLVPSQEASTASTQHEKKKLVTQEPDQADDNADINAGSRRFSTYDLGLGRNRPIDSAEGESTGGKSPPTFFDATQHWYVPEPVTKPKMSPVEAATAVRASAVSYNRNVQLQQQPNINGFVSTRKMVARDQASARLRGAIWDEQHYTDRGNGNYASSPPEQKSKATTASPKGVNLPQLFYPDIDMSIPSTVYNETYDAVWELLRWEAYQEAQREPLLVSFLYSTILNHRSMESSLAFLLANRLSSPMLISTQLQSFILEALEASPTFRRAVRADMLAVRDRDPACTCLPDVFLYFKGQFLHPPDFGCARMLRWRVARLLITSVQSVGFQALQSHRVANWMWRNGKHVLAHFLQSQVSQIWQIDIHPNATVGEGIMLDHGTGTLHSYAPDFFVGWFEDHSL
jgi:Serine acetyltransferase, N-terminal